MESDQDRAGVGPMDVPVGVNGQRVEYQTGKGCLMFALVGLVVAALMVGLILMAGDPVAVEG